MNHGERIGKGQPLFAIEQPELDAAVEDAATEAAAPMLSLLTWKAEAVNRP